LSRTIFSNQRGHATLKDTKKGKAEQSEMGLTLEDLIRRRARELIQKAIEVEGHELLAEYGNVKTLQGLRAVVLHGYLPAREVLTSVGNVEVKVPKVRDRSGAGVKFNSALVPPFVRRSPRMSAARSASGLPSTKFFPKRAASAAGCATRPTYSTRCPSRCMQRPVRAA